LRAQRGRLLELPILGALLVVAGFWIGGKYHPLGFILASIPILLWAGLNVAHALQRFRLAGRRRKIVLKALDGLREGGFDAQLLLKGDLGNGDTWVAFDFTREEAAVLTDAGKALHPLSSVSTIRVAEGARLLGASTPEYYCVDLYFAPADEPYREDASCSVVAPSLRAARRWARELHERLRARVPVTDYAG
jgi:hypothetical protein